MLNVTLLIALLLAQTSPATSDPADSSALDTPAPLATSTVGLPIRIEQLVLPGEALQAKPLTDRHQPLVLRIEATYPHGTAHRYDLEVYALEPGEYDLRDYLEPASGESPAAELPPLIIRVESNLPAGQVLPSELGKGQLPLLGGYRLVLIVGGLLWVLGLLALIFGGRRRATASVPEVVTAETLADRLRPLVTQARDGALTTGQQAELERGLIALWCRRLGLTNTSPSDAFTQLRQHSEAGPLLRQLEQWLHAPGSNREIDTKTLLAPYENMSADEWEAVSALDRRSTGNATSEVLM